MEFLKLFVNVFSRTDAISSGQKTARKNKKNSSHSRSLQNLGIFYKDPAVLKILGRKSEYINFLGPDGTRFVRSHIRANPFQWPL